MIICEMISETVVSLYDSAFKLKAAEPELYVQTLFINSSPPRQNGRHFPGDIFKCIFMNEKFCILIQISLKFAPKGPINNIPALV